MEKMKYVHIGMPKNLSTTLQRDFFSKHPQIMHLGVGLGSNIDYINPEISAACENHFQYSKKFSYKKAKDNIKRSFDKQFEIFTHNSNYKACGISLELLSFTFTPDQIDVEDKAERVFEVFGKNTKVIIIIRQQFKLLESLYKEAIKIGFYGSFQDYLEYIYYSRDRNFVFDFNYNYLFELYGSYFGKENIVLLPIETYRKKSGDLIMENNEYLLTQALSKELGVDYLKEVLNHYNKPLSNTELYNMMKLNSQNVHGIGNSSYSTGTNFHRLKDYFSFELGLEMDDKKLFQDARIKNENIKKASEASNNKEVVFKYPPHIKEFLAKTFYDSNRELQQKVKIDLPGDYFS
ncbi:hypothetical protein F3C99_09370 [Vitellibacter sp. q18]|nr:hypothetical protein [Aequorivita lutea]